MINLTQLFLFILVSCGGGGQLFTESFKIGNLSWNEGAPTAYSAYMQIPFCLSKAPIYQPNNIEEVVEIVRQANKKDIHVKPIGARYSITDFICTDGIPLDMKKFKKTVLNSDNTAIFGTGVTLREATSFLKRHKRALKTIPGYGNLTTGGMLGTGAHGSSMKYSALSSQVIEMTIVDGMGDLRRITLDEELQAFRTNLGLLGVVVEITVRTVPLYKMRAHNYIMSESILTDGRVQDLARNSDQISIYWFPITKKVVVSKLTMVDVRVSGKARTNNRMRSTHRVFNEVIATLGEVAFKWMESSSDSFASIGHKLLSMGEYHTQNSLLRKMPLMIPTNTEDNSKVQNPAVGYYDEMTAPICPEVPTADGLACPWAHGDSTIDLNYIDNDVAIDIKDLSKVVHLMKDVMKRTPTSFPLFGIQLRFSGNSSTYMANSYGRDVVHIGWRGWLRNKGRDYPPPYLAGYQTSLQILFKRFGGRSHWGKTGLAFHSNEILQRNLDVKAMAKFSEMMSKYDPKSVFLNNFGKRFLGLNSKLDCNPFINRCGLMDSCICRTSSDCGVKQICSSITGYDSTKVCMKKPATRKEKEPPLLLSSIFRNETEQENSIGDALSRLLNLI